LSLAVSQGLTIAGFGEATSTLCGKRPGMKKNGLPEKLFLGVREKDFQGQKDA
jgi:hypothetical protein